MKAKKVVAALHEVNVDAAITAGMHSDPPSCEWDCGRVAVITLVKDSDLTNLSLCTTCGAMYANMTRREMVRPDNQMVAAE